LKKIIFVLILIFIFTISCKFSEPAWQYASESISNLDFDGNFSVQVSNSVSMMRSISGQGVDEGNKVYFRSSDIEFWSFDSISDISTFSSWSEDYDNGGSLKYDMGDNVESIVFYPDSNISNDLSNNFNPTWNTKVNNFISSNMFTGKMNLCRLDLGSGHVGFIKDGTNIDVNLMDLPTINSILFVDESYLSESFLIKGGDTVEDILNGSLTKENLAISEDDYNLIFEIFSIGCSSNNYKIDVDGALFIPFTPFDISLYDPSSNSLLIEITWDMNSSIYEDLDGFHMENRVSGTCFDFKVAIKIE